MDMWLSCRYSPVAPPGETVEDTLKNAKESLELALEEPGGTDLECLAVEADQPVGGAIVALTRPRG